MTEDQYLEPYRRSSRHHGAQFGVTLWASPGSQQRRFEVFAQMCDFTGRRVLDAGCSRGDLALFLRDRGIAYHHYVGVDALPQVIEFARSRDIPRATFLAADFVRQPAALATGEPDLICISGSLNTMPDDLVLRVLGLAWQATRKSLIFNFLSDRCGEQAPPQDDYARRLNTLALLDWAFEQTWCVSFRQDYFKHGHDATILMHRPAT
jgi:SAM-dependent methyltransferase